MKLTAWPLSQTNIIESNITSKAISSDGFDGNLGNHYNGESVPFTPFYSQDLICSSPYCLPYNSYNVKSENLILDKIIP